MAEISYKIVDQAEGVDLEKELSFSNQFSELFSGAFFKYLFSFDGSVPETLVVRDFLLNRHVSKRSFYRRIKNPLTLLGFAIVFGMITWAVHCDWLATIDRFYLNDNLQPNPWTDPDQWHWLGKMHYGYDVFGRMIWGARTSLTVGLLSIFVSVVFGVVTGTIVAYQGGIIDSVVMRIVDVIMAFPSLILVILVVNTIGTQNIQSILLTYGVLGIPGYARFMRGSVLQEKTRIYVQAAKVAGASPARIMFRHVLPNAITPVLIAVTSRIGTITLSLAGLAYIGYGADDMIEWGADVSANRSRLRANWYAAFFPGFAIMITVLGFILLGDGLRDAFDPRSKV